MYTSTRQIGLAKYHKKQEIVNRFAYKEDRYRYMGIGIHSKAYIKHTGEVIVQLDE